MAGITGASVRADLAKMVVNTTIQRTFYHCDVQINVYAAERNKECINNPRIWVFYYISIMLAELERGSTK